MNGGFSNWSGYGECSVTCGTGSHDRTRQCNNPKPAHGGNKCAGDVKQTKECKMKPCPGKIPYKTHFCMSFSRCHKTKCFL